MLKLLSQLKTKIFQTSVLLTLPLLTGCNGGGGGIAVGSLLGKLDTQPVGGPANNNLPSVQTALNPEVLADCANQACEMTLAQVHNPEPATMLLMGSGVAAMAYYRRRKHNA
jgi:hypothetical protein